MFYMCPFCGQGQPFESTEHMDNCYPNATNGGCFSCGSTTNQMTNSQRAKELFARCTSCVASRRIEKYAPYEHLYFVLDYWDDRSHLGLDKQLMKSVSGIDRSTVEQLLFSGANPNYCRQESVVKHGRLIWVYDADGTPIPESDCGQPSTPLKLCVFRMSDCRLGIEERQTLVEIAELLIQRGANRSGVAEFFRSRYGTPDRIYDEANRAVYQRLYDLLVGV